MFLLAACVYRLKHFLALLIFRFVHHFHHLVLKEVKMNRRPQEINDIHNTCIGYIVLQKFTNNWHTFLQNLQKWCNESLITTCSLYHRELVIIFCNR